MIRTTNAMRAYRCATQDSTNVDFLLWRAEQMVNGTRTASQPTISGEHHVRPDQTGCKVHNFQHFAVGVGGLAAVHVHSMCPPHEHVVLPVANAAAVA